MEIIPEPLERIARARRTFAPKYLYNEVSRAYNDETERARISAKRISMGGRATAGEKKKV